MHTYIMYTYVHYALEKTSILKFFNFEKKFNFCFCIPPFSDHPAATNIPSWECGDQAA